MIEEKRKEERSRARVVYMRKNVVYIKIILSIVN